MVGISHPANFFGPREPQRAQFKMQHHLRHTTYDYAASAMGVSLPGLDLTGEITPDWLMRHGARHATYRALIVGQGTAGRAGLESIDWTNEDALTSWMQTHLQLHNQLDQFFGLSS
jgi:hypothetical protein